MKKESRILVSAFLILLISFLIFNSRVIDIINKPTINTKATQGTLSVSIIIPESAKIENNVNIPSSGNLTFTENSIKQVIILVSGLTPGWVFNATLYNDTYPTAWSEQAPNQSEIRTKIRHFELTSANDTSGGNYKIYFNISSSELGSIVVQNVSLFTFGTNWSNLSTTIVDSSSDPKQLYAAATHFSKFIVGENPASSGQGQTPAPSPGQANGITGTAGNGGGNQLQTGEVTKEPEPVKPKPIHLIGNLFDINVLIPEKYSELFSYEELVSEIKIINIKRTGLVNINLEYTIEDKDKHEIYHEYESKTFDNSITFLKQIGLPSNIKPGYYMFVVKLKDNKDTAIAGYPFKIKEIKNGQNIILDNIYAWIALGLIIFLMILLYKFRKIKASNEIKSRKEGIYKQLKGVLHEKEK